jgi:hypothetical protein
MVVNREKIGIFGVLTKRTFDKRIKGFGYPVLHYISLLSEVNPSGQVNIRENSWELEFKQ